MAPSKIIHQCWLDPQGAENPPPEDVEANSREWRRLHPDFHLITWTEKELEPALRDVATLDVWAAVNCCRLAAMKSDVIRLALVFKFGGVWSDLKNLPLRSFLNDLFGLRAPVFVEHPPMPNRPDPTGYVCNAFIISDPEDPFILACLHQACVSIKAKDEAGVFAVTGGGLIMKMLERSKRSGSSNIGTLLKYGETWNTLMRRTAASYNADDQHWSIRQKTESLYVNS